jgi:regulator of protease activity HflC (stomatin/prohibitin superfamily)
MHRFLSIISWALVAANLFAWASAWWTGAVFFWHGGLAILTVVAALLSWTAPQARKKLQWTTWHQRLVASAALLAQLLYISSIVTALVHTWFQPPAGMWWVGIFGVVAFVLKWLERSSIATAAWHLANTARCGIFVMLTALIPVAVTEMLQQTWLAAIPTWWLVYVTAGLLSFSVLELGFRAGLRFASLPVPPSNSIGALLGGGQRHQGSFLERVHHATGVDLTASWAIRFSIQAAPICLLILIAMMWLISSISFVPANKRGILERFGEPIAVLQAGMHFHSPWPFDRVHRIDHGTVHKVRLIDGIEMMADARDTRAPSDNSVAQDDRRWEIAHGKEVYFLSAPLQVAKKDGTQEKRGVRRFEIINADISIHYRVGLRDEDALAAHLAMVDVGDVLSRTARQWVQRVFAGSTPEQLLAKDRSDLAAAMGDHVQSALDHLGSGIEIVTISFEAIHPPIIAAEAFTARQVAEMEAQGLIANAQSQAAVKHATANAKATEILDTARGQAADITGQARTESTLFLAAVESHFAEPAAYELETRLDKLLDGTDRRRLVVLDHRLDADAIQHVVKIEEK